MTSKEALNRLSKYIGKLGGGETLEEEVILKDLEVLEIIKALFKENVELGSKVCIDKNYYDINFLLFNSKEAYNKIKEWLEDDK